MYFNVQSTIPCKTFAMNDGGENESNNEKFPSCKAFVRILSCPVTPGPEERWPDRGVLRTSLLGLCNCLMIECASGDCSFVLVFTLAVALDTVIDSFIKVVVEVIVLLVLVVELAEQVGLVEFVEFVELVELIEVVKPFEIGEVIE